MAARVGPDHVTFVLVDYKGGATFDACADLPHTVGLVTDLDDGLAARALVSLEAEVHRRERLLRQSGADRPRRPSGGRPVRPRCHDSSSSSTSSRRSPSTSPTSSPPWSGSPSAAAVSGCTSCSPRNGRRGWSTTTSAPTRTCDWRCASTTAPTRVDVVGDPAPAALPRGVPGRAVMRLGPGDVVEFQVARCTAPLDGGDGDAETELASARRRDPPGDDHRRPRRSPPTVAPAAARRAA